MGVQGGYLITERKEVNLKQAEPRVRSEGYHDIPDVGELRLIRAMVLRAYCDARGSNSGDHCKWENMALKARREAIEWILCGDRGPWSFLWSCEQLFMGAGSIETIQAIARGFSKEVEFGCQSESLERYGT